MDHGQKAAELLQQRAELKIGKISNADLALLLVMEALAHATLEVAKQVNYLSNK